MQKKIINILLAVPKLNSSAFVNGVKAQLKETPHFQTLNFFVSHTIEEVDSLVSKKKTDVVICAEDLGSEKVGAGCLKRWKQVNTDIKIILILEDEKRSGTKVQSLLSEGYTDGIFTSDLSPDSLTQLIAFGRTMEEAKEYYLNPVPKEAHYEKTPHVDEEKDLHENLPEDDPESTDLEGNLEDAVPVNPSSQSPEQSKKESTKKAVSKKTKKVSAEEVKAELSAEKKVIVSLTGTVTNLQTEDGILSLKLERDQLLPFDSNGRRFILTIL